MSTNGMPIKQIDEDVNVENGPPPSLICQLCSKLMQKAIVMKCCDNSFCEDCIEETILMSEDPVCPAGECLDQPIGIHSYIVVEEIREAVQQWLEASKTPVIPPTTNSDEITPMDLSEQVKSLHIHDKPDQQPIIIVDAVTLMQATAPTGETVYPAQNVDIEMAHIPSSILPFSTIPPPVQFNKVNFQFLHTANNSQIVSSGSENADTPSKILPAFVAPPPKSKKTVTFNFQTASNIEQSAESSARPENADEDSFVIDRTPSQISVAPPKKNDEIKFGVQTASNIGQSSGSSFCLITPSKPMPVAQPSKPKKTTKASFVCVSTSNTQQPARSSKRTAKEEVKFGVYMSPIPPSKHPRITFDLDEKQETSGQVVVPFDPTRPPPMVYGNTMSGVDRNVYKSRYQAPTSSSRPHYSSRARSALHTRFCYNGQTSYSPYQRHHNNRKEYGRSGEFNRQRYDNQRRKRDRSNEDLDFENYRRSKNYQRNERSYELVRIRKITADGVEKSNEQRDDLQREKYQNRRDNSAYKGITRTIRVDSGAEESKVKITVDDPEAGDVNEKEEEDAEVRSEYDPFDYPDLE